MTEIRPTIEYTTFDMFPEAACGSVVVIGNFDGVHKGHRALIAQARAVADRHNTSLSVLTFEPHPRQVFRPDDPPFRLTTDAVKERLLHEIGVDFVLTLNFGPALSAKTPDMFIQDILVEGIGAGYVMVGSDFCFGKDRAGTVEDLKAAETKGLFDVEIFDPIKTEDSRKVYSSSLARQALREGDIETANAILGWSWEIDGEVIKGDGRGASELGTPTANIDLGVYLRPAFGVYAVRIGTGEDEKDFIWRNGVANIGIRPMFKLDQPLCEAHIFDFDGDLYGQILRVQLVKYLRAEENYSTIEVLKAQIAKDCEAAKKALDC